MFPPLLESIYILTLSCLLFCGRLFFPCLQSSLLESVLHTGHQKYLFRSSSEHVTPLLPVRILQRLPWSLGGGPVLEAAHSHTPGRPSADMSRALDTRVFRPRAPRALLPLSCSCSLLPKNKLISTPFPWHLHGCLTNNSYERTRVNVINSDLVEKLEAQRSCRSLLRLRNK